MENEEKKERSLVQNFALIKRFFPYLKKHLKTEICVLLCAITAAASEIILPLIVREITDKGALITYKFLITICLAYVGLKAVESIASYCQAFYGHKMGTKIENSMREDMFDHLQKLSFSYFDNTKVGQLMSRMTSDLFDVAEWAHHFPEMILMTVVKFIASFYIFTTMDIRFAIAVFILFPFMVLLTKKTRTKMRDTFKENRHQIGEINARLEDSLLGVKVVRSFTNEKIEKNKFLEGCDEYIKVKIRGYKYMASFHATVGLINGTMYIAVIAMGAYLMKEGKIAAGDFAASLLLVSTLLNSVRSIVDFSEQFSRGVTGVERFTEIMDEIPEIEDSPDAKDIENVEGEIEFKNVSFSYVKGEKQILSNLNLLFVT